MSTDQLLSSRDPASESCFCCFSSNGDSSCVVSALIWNKFKDSEKMKHKQRNKWQWKLKDWQLTVSGFAVWDGWRLLWSVLLVFTASDQLRGLTSWSNKWVFRDTPYLISTAPRFSSFMSTLSKIKSVYISSSCCCCHLSLFPCTWISSFPRLQAWQPQARQPWPTDNRFPAKICPSIPTY